MAGVGSIAFPQPQAYSGGVDWSPLANLGNVYQKAQEQQRQQDALGRLGTDPTANAQALIQSGVPSLAQLGINLQGQQQTRADTQAQRAEQMREFEQQQAIRNAAEKRAAETYEEDSPEGRIKKVIAAGGDPKDPQWRTYLVTGAGAPDPNKAAKLAELSVSEKKMADDADNRAYFAQDVLDNIKRMREINDKAWSGASSYLSGPAQKYLPSGMVPEGALQTEELKQLAGLNVAEQAKSMFGSRLAVKEVQLLKELEGAPEMDPAARKLLFNNVERLMSRKLQTAQSEGQGIRNKTYFQPGGNQPAQQPAAPETSATLTKPPDRIVNQAKAAIMQGADPKAVRQRLIEGGHDPGDIGK